MLPDFLASLPTGQLCHSPILVARRISILWFVFASLSISGCGEFPLYCYLGFCTMQAPLVPCSTDTDCDDSLGCSMDKCRANGECAFTALCQMDHCLEANCDDCEEFQCVECIADEECTDDNHCTTDACINHACSFALIDCDDQLACTTDGCDSATGMCTHQPTAEAVNCDDGVFCNGLEVMVDCICVAGNPPCGLTIGECDPCDEETHVCAGICEIDQDCDDGIFCNGVETCDGCLCQLGEPSCGIIGFGGSPCDEGRQACGDPCLAQCASGPGACAEKPLEDFGDFQRTLDDWTEEFAFLFAPEFQGQDFPYMVSGVCQDSSYLFLSINLGFTSMTRFFEADSERFVGSYETTDGIFLNCNGIYYWPGRTPCALAIVTEVYLGTLYGIGDAVEFIYPDDFEAP